MNVQKMYPNGNLPKRAGLHSKPRCQSLASGCINAPGRGLPFLLNNNKQFAYTDLLRVAPPGQWIKMIKLYKRFTPDRGNKALAGMI
ncbi:MAG: hypothetical protein WKF97_02845 [Chitinophagaceae bacterium]